MTGPRNRENRITIDLLPNATVCPCLHETGSRRVRVYERCERCGAFMESDLADDYAEVKAERDRAVEALRRYVAVSPWKNRPDDQLTDEEAELLAVLAAVPVEEEKP